MSEPKSTDGVDQEPNERKSLLVFIGRFQPFHRGHEEVLRQALNKADNVLVLVGSSFQPRSVANPFTYQERAMMIRECVTVEGQQRLFVEPLLDAPYRQRLWIRWVQRAVDQWARAQLAPEQANDLANGRYQGIGLVGESRHGTGYYPHLLGEWPALPVATVTDRHGNPISGQPVRDALLQAQGYYEGEQREVPTPTGADYLESSHAGEYVTEPVKALLKGFIAQDEFQDVVAEQRFVDDYQQAWKAAPYPPNFLTADAVVTYGGSVLLVTRKNAPGAGLKAFPGGFVDPTETLEHACIRELREETRIQVEDAVLKHSIRARKIYDEPYRSARGRILTQAIHFDLSDMPAVPMVAPADDAAQVDWVPFSQLRPQTMFEDHYGIAQDLLGLE